jgi:protein TonB
MTNKEILQADLLDILFENRNKAYGAYALRKDYNHRLKWALGISLSFVFLLLILQNQESGKIILKEPPPDLTITSVELPKPKAPELVQPQMHPQVAQIKNTQITIVPDDKVKETEVPTINDLQRALTSTINQDGTVPADANEKANGVNQDSHGNDVKTEKETGCLSPNSEAQFPGGKEAFAKFLTKYLKTPSELEAGEKKVVLVHFMVDADGAISKTEVIQSDGEDYSREVIRVLSKMPKWIPAIQNCTKVTTWFTQPVSFIGVE